MTAERSQFSLALGLSAGVNLLLFLFIAWSMAVTQGLTGNKPGSAMAHAPLAQAAEVLPEVISFVLSAEPEPLNAPKRGMVNSPEDQPDLAPDNPATRFISSTNMRAASEEAASRDGVAGLATQQGLDKPFLDLRDSEFRDGEREAGRPPEASPQPAALSGSVPPLPPPPLPEPPVDDTPPPPTPTKPENSSSAEEPVAADSPPQEEVLSDASQTSVVNTTPAPPAFRDSDSQNLIPRPAEIPVPQFRSKTRPPTPPGPPPNALQRIPDRVPEGYRPGLKKARIQGDISNRGRSSVDAVATAEGRFGKLIRTAIEKTWRRRMLGLASLANPGLVEVEFEVDPKGRISNVRLANPGEANPVMQDCALSAVIEAKLPPPPLELFEELQDNLTGGRMRCSFSFLIY